MRPTIFVSYSHSDGNLVGPVVQLLRASAAHVFRDADDIPAGKKWREELSTALTDARLIMVFWCDHASASPEVQKEYSAAIAQGKDVLPVLIDDTPLPPDLAEYQYIDFRGVFPRGHGFTPPLPPSANVTLSVERASSSHARRWIVASAVLIGIIASWWFAAVYSPGDHGGGDTAPGPSGWLIAAAIGCIVVLVIGLYSWLRKSAGDDEPRLTRISNRPSGTPMGAASVDPRVQQMCQKIDSELRRRIPADDS